MQKNYITILQDGESELMIKKSRFICSLKSVSSEEEAKNFIDQRKKEEYKANHHCHAFIINLEKSMLQHSSDDGEPSGTAGMPMLEVLRKNQLENLVAVVTRYFGGIKLGTGGLIRAYTQAVTQTLDKVGLVEGRLQQTIVLTIHYAQLSKVQAFFDSHLSYYLIEKRYQEDVQLICSVEEDKKEIFIQAITELLNGQLTIEQNGCSYREIPLIKK